MSSYKIKTRKMQFINVIDEQGRFVKLKTYPEYKSEQVDSYTYSYVFAREQFREDGEKMGLEKEIERKENERKI